MYKTMLTQLLLVSVCAIALVPLVSGSGNLEIRLVSFHNDRGLKADGRCCDSNQTVCLTGCDYVFTICLDQNLRSSNTTYCSYGKKVYRALRDERSVHFDEYVASGDHNHFEVRFPHGWPGQLRMIFDVYDYDTRESSDHVVMLVDTLVAQAGNVEVKTISNGDFRYTNIPDNAGDELSIYFIGFKGVEFRVIIQCDGHYYGPGCETYCLGESDDTVSYTCNPNTGAKICSNGYGGPFCNTRCPRGYTGPGCTLFAACTPNPCQNGGICYPDGLNFECDCANTGFTGADCATPARTRGK